MLPLVSDCYQEFNWNPKMWVALLNLTMMSSILIRTPLMSSSKTRAPQPTALLRAFYWNLNSAFSEWTYFRDHQLWNSIIYSQHPLIGGSDNLNFHEFEQIFLVPLAFTFANKILPIIRSLLILTFRLFEQTSRTFEAKMCLITWSHWSSNGVRSCGDI